MKFLADENFDRPVIFALRMAGFDVLSVSESFSNAVDEVVLSKANQENKILLTADKDFGELVFRLKLISTGIVLLRLPDLNNAAKAITLLTCIKEHGTELTHSFTVITSRKIRIIKL